MTQRRTLNAGIAGWLLAAALPGSAQTPGRLYRIGWISNAPMVDQPEPAAAFTAGMREFGWIQGRHYAIENVYTEGRNERLQGLAADLVRRQVDVIVCAGTAAAAAAKAATTTIPIASVPKAARIGLLYNPGFAGHASVRGEAEAAARHLGVSVRAIELRTPADLDPAFAALARDPVDALLVPGQPFLFEHGPRLAALALQQRLPALIAFAEVARAGLLLAYGWQIIDDVRLLPRFVDRLLKGARPAELPIEQPTRFRLVVNLKTAKALGLVIPQSVLVGADEVIE